MPGRSRTTSTSTASSTPSTASENPSLGESNSDAVAAMEHDHGGHDHSGHDHGSALETAQEVLPTPPEKGKAAGASPGAGGTSAAASATAAAGGEVVLTTDAKYAKANYVGWFSGQIKPKIEGWGHTFDAKRVKLANDVGTKGTSGIVLDWDSAWGTKPTTSPIPFSMAPIDAKAGSKAVQDLDGWKQVAEGKRGQLAALIGGEQNKLSAKARDKLRPDFAALKGKAAGDQASDLEALMTDKAAKPDVINTKSEGAPSTYKLTGPAEKKDYAFIGKKADAEEWTCTFDDGQVIPIIAPKAPEAGHHYHTVAQAAEAASYLPGQSRKVVTRIVLNVIENPKDPDWAVKYKRPDFHSYMTAGAAGQITIYPDDSKAVPGMEAMKGSMVHETGHTWSYKTWGNDKTKGKWAEWQTAMDKDGMAISGYAMSSIAEDVAETVQAYASTKGSPRFDEYKAIVPARFAMLDAEYK